MVPAPARGATTPAPIAGPGVPPEQIRARYPDASGFVDRDGVRVFYEVYGTGEPAVLILPTWSIVHSRIWKLQIPDLARRSRVITFDPRGNGGPIDRLTPPRTRKPNMPRTGGRS